MEISFVFLELDEYLMACVLWKDEWETKAEEFVKKIKSWRYYEDDLERMWRWRWMQMWRFCPWNFKTDEEFQKLMVEFVMESFEANIFSKRYDGNAYRTQIITLNAKKRTSLKSSMKKKLSNQNGADLFQIKEDDCNIISCNY